MMAFTSDQWAILALVFILGLLVGAFLFAGSGRKWKHRYRAEEQRREEIERANREREEHWASREKEWREQDSLRGAAIKDRDRDGVRDSRDPVDDRDRRDLDYRDRDADGVRDSRDPVDDRDRRPR